MDASEDDSEAVTKFRQAVEELISDRRETRSIDGEFEAESIPMEGSMASAEWTAFDQLAQQREDLDDSLDWSIVVRAAGLALLCLLGIIALAIVMFPLSCS